MRRIALAASTLVVAVAGTAIALPGKNTVNSGDIKNGQVKTKDLGANSATGAKVREATLGTVPNAATAGNAATVAGTEVRSFLVEVSTNSPSEFFEFGGVNVEMNCADGDPLATAASTSTEDASLVVAGVFNDGAATPFSNRDSTFTDQDFDSLTTFDDNDSNGQSTAQVVFADGTVTTIDLSWNNEVLGGGSAGCTYWGRATSG